MEKFRTQLESVSCPRCHSKMLRQFIVGLMRKSGKLKKTAAVVENDTHPACRWEGSVKLISIDEAEMRIHAFNMAKAGKSFINLSQPEEK